MRDENTLFLQIEADVKSPITIPRLAAPLRSMHWSDKDKGKSVADDITLKPGTDTWEIHWKNRPDDQVLLDGKAMLVLEFDDEPLLLSEVKPVKATGDGSFYLPAHLAITRGEKVRYEPQTFKNTVGFWVGKNDSAHWTIRLDKPGRFNVAVLQGCGKGHGGSTAQMMLKPDKPAKSTETWLDFQVKETGHWQNFQWVQLGEIELADAAKVEIVVAPKQIKKAALMDIRAIHLIRLPDRKR
ncbi:MAG: hypothetical protein AAGB26_18450 [Planctomycetota bacterium]